MTDIHASCVCWQNRGILLLGASGSGKSDLCLRLISGQGAELVADDRVDLIVSRETIYASAPEILAGMLEVRGVGILKLPSLRRSRLDLAVELVSAPQEVERRRSRLFGSSAAANCPCCVCIPLKLPLLIKF